MKILIADDDLLSRRHLEFYLKKSGFDVIAAADGNETWSAIRNTREPLLALIDWMMPGINGDEICTRIKRLKNHLPVYSILLTSKSGTEEIVSGLNAGADDYLVKPFKFNELFARIRAGERILDLQTTLADRILQLEESIVERKRAEEALRLLSLTDDLTGLYNRRGLLTLTEHYLENARRSNQNALLFNFDMDGLKQINDRFGHSEGSQAIKNVGNILRQSFRQSDIIGRVGGDEFLAIATNTGIEGKKVLATRLRDNFLLCNSNSGKEYQLSVSYGVVRIDPQKIPSIPALIEASDVLMYKEKKKKKALANLPV